MDLKKLLNFKENKNLIWITVLFAAGIILILTGDFIKMPQAENSKTPVVSEQKQSEDSYETDLEKRLEDILSLVEGAGKVKVMLKTSYSKEIVVAEDYTNESTTTKETDRNGGEREVVQSKTTDKTIMSKQADGTEAALILKEIEPKIEGVIIVAQGGDDIFVKDSCIKAVQAVLGIEPHKVQVLKMK